MRKHNRSQGSNLRLAVRTLRRRTSPPELAFGLSFPFMYSATQAFQPRHELSIHVLLQFGTLKNYVPLKLHLCFQLEFKGY
jgi:hypothetical protein